MAIVERHAPLPQTAPSTPLHGTAPGGSTGAPAPSRWQAFKSGVSQAFHKAADFFHAVRDKVANLLQRNPTPAPTSTSRQISLGEAKAMIAEGMAKVRGHLNGKPNANPPQPALQVRWEVPDSLNTFLRQTGQDTAGHEVSKLLRPFMKGLATEMRDLTQKLLLEHGQNGQPANIELDPIKDPSVNDPGERDRRVAIIADINQKVMEQVVGKPGSPQHQSLVENLPLPVKVVISELTQEALSRCNWDTSPSNTNKTPEQQALEKRIPQLVLAHVMLTGLVPVIAAEGSRLRESQPVMSSGLILMSKLLQSEFNLVQPGVKETHLSVLNDVAESTRESISAFAEHASFVGSHWGGVGDFQDVPVAMLYS